MKNEEKVCVLGLGYIGLSASSLIVDFGYKVLGVDTNKTIIENLQNGKSHIHEPGIECRIQEGIKSGQLEFSQVPQESDIYIIAVQTPLNLNNEPDLDYVYQAVDSIIPLLKPGNLVIIESTVPVGTTKDVMGIIEQKNPYASEIYLTYCPERVLPGNIIKELTEVVRILGGINTKSTEKAEKFYRNFVNSKLMLTDSNTAEMTKLIENSFRDINIAFANEVSMICDAHGIDTHTLIKFANEHPRVNILDPGCGVGGHCLAIDPMFLVHTNPSLAKLIKSARDVNNDKTSWVINKIKEQVKLLSNDDSRNIKIACMGLTYKADVNDLRNSPALEIAQKLISSGYSVMTVEPNIDSLEGLNLTTIDQAVKESDLIVILVRHKEFKDISYPEGMSILDFS